MHCSSTRINSLSPIRPVPAEFRAIAKHVIRGIGQAWMSSGMALCRTATRGRGRRRMMMTLAHPPVTDTRRLRNEARLPCRSIKRLQHTASTRCLQTRSWQPTQTMHTLPLRTSSLHRRNKRARRARRQMVTLRMLKTLMLPGRRKETGLLQPATWCGRPAKTSTQRARRARRVVLGSMPWPSYLTSPRLGRTCRTISWPTTAHGPTQMHLRSRR